MCVEWGISLIQKSKATHQEQVAKGSFSYLLLCRETQHLYNYGAFLVHMVQKRGNLELDIIELLLHKEAHVRGIAKSLDESHTTISRKLNNLVKENVIDFRKEGKNKIFFLKKSFVAKNYVLKAESHKLTKLLRKYPELSIIFEEILKKTDEDLIILFGSYAKGIAKKSSDIDIYIETKNRNVKKEVEAVNSRIKVKIGSFDTKSNLIKEIVKNHIIIRGAEKFYEKKQVFE